VAPAFPEPGDVVTICGQTDRVVYCKGEWYSAAQGEKLAVKKSLFEAGGSGLSGAGRCCDVIRASRLDCIIVKLNGMVQHRVKN